MRLFLSWSGPTSRDIARVFRDWLETLPSGLRPFMSQRDIKGGQRGLRVLQEELEGSRYGLLFMTRDNLDSEWIHFEAGAIAKTIEGTRVWPILFGGVTVPELSGPLGQFQAKPFTEADMRELCVELSNASEDTISADAVTKAFDRAWPELHAAIEQILVDAPPGRGPRARPSPLDEILNLSRGISLRLDTLEASTSANHKRRTGVPIETQFGCVLASTVPSANFQVDGPGSMRSDITAAELAPLVREHPNIRVLLSLDELERVMRIHQVTMAQAIRESEERRHRARVDHEESAKRKLVDQGKL